MRPPICAFCGKDFRDTASEGGLVKFKLTADQIKSNLKQMESDIVAHPKGQEWFCGEHIEAAKKHSHLSLKSALMVMSTPTFTNQCLEKIANTSVISLYKAINKNWQTILHLMAVDEEIVKMTPTTKKDKSWSPMDGHLPPNCPYSLTGESKTVSGQTSIAHSYTVAYWNDDEKSNAHYSFYYTQEKKILFALSAYANANNPIICVDFRANQISPGKFKQIVAKIMGFLVFKL